MNENDILPTCSCFDDALDYIGARLMAHPSLVRSTDMFLVHGIAVGGRDGEPYAHAWVEEGDDCWDAGILRGQRIWYSIKHDEFYAARLIITTTRYTVKEALRENIRSNHYGPWEAKYQALCNNGGPRRILGSMQVDGSGAKIREW